LLEIPFLSHSPVISEWTMESLHQDIWSVLFRLGWFAGSRGQRRQIWRRSFKKEYDSVWVCSRWMEGVPHFRFWCMCQRGQKPAEKQPCCSIFLPGKLAVISLESHWTEHRGAPSKWLAELNTPL
jgi:hypothetical protein